MRDEPTDTDKLRKLSKALEDAKSIGDVPGSLASSIEAVRPEVYMQEGVTPPTHAERLQHRSALGAMWERAETGTFEEMLGWALDNAKEVVMPDGTTLPGNPNAAEERLLLSPESDGYKDHPNAADDARMRRHPNFQALKPEFQEHMEREIDVTFHKDKDSQRWIVESPALEHPVSVTAKGLPMEMAVTLATMSNKPPMVRPNTVPEVRIEMFDTAVDMWRKDMYPENPDYSAKAMQWVAETLAAADLYWVSPEMCQLLAHAAPTLPPTTLTEDLMPSESGVVFFADALEGQDAQDENHHIWVSAIAWGPCTFDVTDTTRVEGAKVNQPPPGAISPVPSTVVPSEGFNPADYGLEPGDEFRFRGNGISISTWQKWERWVPLGRTDWPMGFDTEGAFAPPNFTQVQLDSIIEDRRWAAAFAILSQQTNIATTRVVDTDRHAAKRLKRRKYPVPKVRLVDIHKPKHAPSGKTRDVEWTKRWIVKGHWRQQAVGPGRKQRRPTYIQPHIKGPEDKPLEVSPEIVRVWRR